MSRLYRTALAYYESFEPTKFEEESWESLDELRSEFAKEHPERVEDFVLRRPRMGGELWHIDDEDECEAVVNDMIDGMGLMPEIDPIVEILQSHHAHEDFSDRYSWIKEDFERSFYSKRSKVKVTLVETIDEFPSWNASGCSYHQDMVFRDLLSCFNLRDQRLLIAVRHGKTQTEIAEEIGVSGHATISRRLARIKEKVRKLLS